MIHTVSTDVKAFPIINTRQMLIIVPAQGEGYCIRGALFSMHDILALHDDDTVDFLCLDVVSGAVVSLTEVMAQMWLARHDDLDFEADMARLPLFVQASNALMQYVS